MFNYYLNTLPLPSYLPHVLSTPLPGETPTHTLRNKLGTISIAAATLSFSGPATAKKKRLQNISSLLFRYSAPGRARAPVVLLPLLRQQIEIASNSLQGVVHEGCWKNDCFNQHMVQKLLYCIAPPGQLL